MSIVQQQRFAARFPIVCLFAFPLISAATAFPASVSANQLTICKKTIPSMGQSGPSFNFTGANSWPANSPNRFSSVYVPSQLPSNPFSMKDGDCRTLNLTGHDQYNKITENGPLPTGWTLTNISCTYFKSAVKIFGANSNPGFQPGDNTVSIDQNEPTAWGIDPQEGEPHRACFELKQPLRVKGQAGTIIGDGDERLATRLRIVLKQRHGRSHLIGRMRISVTDAATPIRTEVVPASISAIVAISPAERSDPQRVELAAFQQLEDVNHALSALPKPSLVYAAAADFEPDGSMHPPPGPRPIHILHRGDIRQPRQEVTPGAITSITSVPAQFVIPAGEPESSRRAALARWLTDRENPLTWRSIVNRVWHHHFGRGLVGTLNDFGHMGETPSHPELLDWLAIEFRDHGQSLKSLHRLILTSATYQQTATGPISKGTQHPGASSELDSRLAVDADNRLLWRMNRTRLDAECVRDAVLAISGRLDLRMGGPSDRQFDLQPGIHVTPKVDYNKFDLNSDLGRRRSVYRFLFRTLPDPFMESLDCPSGDQMTPARGNSVTVQQALALWNDAFMANSCQQIAERIQREASGEANDRVAVNVTLAFRLILCRLPTAGESAESTEYATRHGMANLCRVLLNSNEFLFVN